MMQKNIQAEANIKIKKPVLSLPLLALLVAVIAVAAALYIFIYKKPLPNILEERPIVKDTLPDGYKFVAAPKGEYPEGFPKELVLPKDAEVIRGENTVDGSGTTQKTLEFMTASLFPELLNLYQTKLSSKGWQVIDSAHQGEMGVIVFEKGSTILNVIISPKTASSTQVSLNISQNAQ